MFIEETRRIPLSGSYDVAVVGGGIAGVSAALAAARLGKSVILFERMFCIGGLATSGLVTIYLPICDGNGHQVCYGIAEELLRLSIMYGFEDRYPDAWLKVSDSEERRKKRFEVQFNGNVFAILMEQALLKAGVRIAYGSVVRGATLEDRKIKTLIVENKSGRLAYEVGSVVDSSGDADIAVITGEKTVVFKKGNPLAAWYYETTDGEYRLRPFGICDASNELKKDGKEEPIGKKRYTGLDETELSEMVCLSHSKLLDNFLAGGGVSRKHALSSIASIPQIRMTRRIDGVYCLDEDEAFINFEDSIGLVPDWRKRGPVFEIPFRCLHGSEVKNLLFAGRCISVSDRMWEITRVIPSYAVTGEAAGTAAALCDDFTVFDCKAVQSVLINNGVRIHIKDLNL